MTNVWLFCGYVLVSAAGLILIKQAGTPASARFVGGFLLYGAGFIIWLWLLRRLPLSMAFPAAAGALIAATVAGGYFFLGERLAASQTFGVVMILIGIVLVFWRSVPQ